jgi:hypothetical protein
MASTLPETQIQLENPVVARKYARIIAFAILAGAGAFAAVLSGMVKGATPPGPATDHALYMPFLLVSLGLVLVATTIGTRMHVLRGTLGERSRKTLMTHVITMALSEAAVFLGLVLVWITRSWDAILPAALGIAGLVTSTIRGEVRFGALVEEQNALNG